VHSASLAERNDDDEFDDWLALYEQRPVPPLLDRTGCSFGQQWISLDDVDPFDLAGCGNASAISTSVRSPS